jgi:superfamily I DNA/RNA helicase
MTVYCRWSRRNSQCAGGDEYQSLGVALLRIVTRVAFDGGVRLFAVGDPDQPIYGFIGADGKLLLELADRGGYNCS